MDVTQFLACLTGVKKSTKGSWVACCPAHEDRTPSLAVKELDDGRILLHCFGGCGTDAVMRSMGLSLSDLFPEPIEHHMSPVRGFSAADALRCLSHEAAFLTIVSHESAQGKPLSTNDQERIAVAAGRISEALEYTLGR